MLRSMQKMLPPMHHVACVYVCVFCLIQTACSPQTSPPAAQTPASKPVASADSSDSVDPAKDASSERATPTTNDPVTATSPASETQTVADKIGGTLNITFKFKGAIPPSNPPQIKADKTFCGKVAVTDESLIIDPTTKGIQNVVVYIYSGRRGTKLAPQPARKRKLILDNKNCVFQPHIMLAQVGDTITVKNSDPVGHNANFAFFNNQPFAGIVPFGQDVDVQLTQSEPAVVPVVCNIHPWMQAHVLVTEHPYAGVSNAQGKLTIKDLPPGKIIFRAWHERLTFKNGVSINGQTSEWKSNKFELDIQPGQNDLGTVEVALSP